MSLRRIRLSPARRVVADLSWASLRVPRCLMTAELMLPRTVAARSALAAPRPPWTTLFTKAFAIVAEDRPALRRLYATLPVPRLLELDHAIGCVVLEREHEGEPALSIARFTEPQARPLAELAAMLHHAKTAPPMETKSFRRILRFARLPWPMRRLMMRIALGFGAPLLRYGGSFGISALGHQGAAIIDSVSVVPVFLSYGPIAADGRVQFYISFDHRVMDGAEGAAAMRALEQALEGPVTAELEAMQAPTVLVAGAGRG